MNLIFKIIILSLVSITLFGQQSNDAWLTQGNNNYRQGDYKRALMNYENYIQIQPEDPVGYLLRARVHEVMGNTGLSQVDLNIAQNLNPLSLIHINPALRSIHLARKSYDYNFENLNKAFYKSPAKLTAYKSVLDQIDLGHSQDSLIDLVLKHLNNKDIIQAESILDEIEVNPMNQSIILDLKGKALMKQGKYVKAKDVFIEAINHNPRFAIAYHNLSICYSLLDQQEEAKINLMKAISLKDDVSLFYFTLAQLNEGNSNNEDAIENYEKAISLDSEYKEAMVNYSQLLKSLGEYEGGLSYLDKAINMVDDDERKYLEANLKFVYGEYDDALQLYKSYLLTHPEDGDALYNIGLTKILLRRSVEGCSDIDQSLTLQTDKEREKLHNLFCKK